MEVSDEVVRYSSINKFERAPQLFRIILFCSFFEDLLTMWNAYCSQRDFESGPWEAKQEDSSHGEEKAPLGATQRLSRNQILSLSSFWETPACAESDACGQEVCQETKFEGASITKEAHIEAIQKSKGKHISLPLSQQGVDAIHKYPDVQFILKALTDSLVVQIAEGDLLLEDDLRVTQDGQVGNGESGRLSHCTDSSSRSVRVLRLCFVLEGTSYVRAIRKL